PVGLVDGPDSCERCGGIVAVLGGLGEQAARPFHRIGVGARLDPGGRGYLRREDLDLLLLLGKQFRSGTATIAEPLLDVAETGGVEQTLEQPAALLAVRAQEPGEVALRKEHHLEEL